MKAPASFRWFFLVVTAIVLLFHPRSIFATDSVFEDEFNSSPVDSTNWQIYPNLYGAVDIVNNEALSLSSSFGRKFPYVFLKNTIFPENNYSIRTRFRFSGSLTYGNGLVFSDINLPNNTSTGLSGNEFIFAIWTTSPTTVALVTTLCTTELASCTNGVPTVLHSISSTSWNNLSIDEVGDHYVITLADRRFETKDSSRKISQFWVGNPQTTNTSQNWASIFVDYFYVSNLPVGKVPVVVIPGFGGSWDLEAIMKNETGTNWRIPSFIKNYDGIVQSFKNAGFVEDENLFIFPYDWRKPLSSLADDLKSFIDSKSLAGKVNLVGHSMGGLVARSFAQKYGTGKVDKILTAGSPHLGLIDMYGLWEGAKLWDGVWWQNVLLEIATEVNRLPDETKVAAIRRVSPSVLDLFPTFPFLVSGGGTQGIDTMIQRNTYLKSLNQNFSVLGDKLTPFWSDDIASTRNTINVSPRTDADALEQKWEDGRPYDGDPFGRTLGDGTVTKDSAVGPFGAGEKLTGWHSDLVSTQDNVGKIFEKLGLDPTFAVSAETDNRINSFVAILRSPGTLEVCNILLTLCDEQLGGIYFSEYKLFILPGYNRNDLVVRVKESGEFGSYKLHLGNIDDSPDWVVEDGILIAPGQVDFYGVKNSGENISVVFDNIPPVVEITAPENEFYKTADVPALVYSVSDNWDLNPDVATEGWSDTEGEHTVTVTASDLAGNVGSRSVTYTVQNPPTNKDQCKRNGWRFFRLLGFKNQGSCESFVLKQQHWYRHSFF